MITCGTNIISDKAKIGKNVKIRNFVRIYDNLEVGDNSVIESFCEIGYFRYSVQVSYAEPVFPDFV